MVGGSGSMILSLSLLGRPVQTQPRSRMAQSHLQKWLFWCCMRKMAGEAQLLAGQRTGLTFSPSWSISCMGKHAGMCRGGLFGGMDLVALSSITSPSQDKGCGGCCGQEAAFPSKEVVCPLTSTSLQPL